jgi:hypothetical protein
MEDAIKKISLTRNEEREINIPLYKLKVMGNPYYVNIINQYRDILIEERKNYNHNIEFYKAIAQKFVKTFIPEMINDYGEYLSDEKVNKLINIANGDGLKILEQGEAVKLGLIGVDKNGRKNGDEGAFAKSDIGIIGFTPDSEISDLDLNNKTEEEKQKVAVENCLKMLGSMIHETFHIMINVTSDEHFYWIKDGIEESQLTSGGFIINEGIVEKHAIEFAVKHCFIQNPALDYFHYVNLCNEIEQIIGTNQFEQLSFNSKYSEILIKSMSEKEQELYKYHERKKYLEKRGILNSEPILYNEKNLSNSMGKQM